MTNRTFEDLQRRCRNLNRKRWIKRLFILLFLFVLAAISYFGYINHKKGILEKSEDVVKAKKVTPKQKEIRVIVEKKEKPIKIKKTPEKNITVSKTDEKNISKKIETKDNILQSYNTVFLKPTIVIPVIKKQEQVKKNINRVIPKETVIESNISIVQNQPIKKKKIYIKVKSLEDEESLLKANKAGESFESTMKLSNFYLKKSKFEKAIYWSKKANHYKPSSFEPWLIYAQSKIKQGKKDEAVKAIETFLSYFNSNEGEKYLQSIRRDK